MTKRLTWRYKCEHCGKTGASSYHMKRHESRCTLNPLRECGMCAAQAQLPRSMEELVTIASEINFDPSVGYDNVAEKLLLLRNATKDCPACILAALRQAKVSMEVSTHYVYSEEVTRFWQQVNDAMWVLEQEQCQHG